MMNPEQLVTFLAVAKHLNYTHAGEELHLSQSAVWRQMRQLEGRLGVALFEQIGKDLHLTSAGKTLVAEARGLLGQLARIEESLHSHETEIKGELRIGASTTPGFYLVPGLLGAFRSQHPEVDLHFEVTNSEAIEQKLVRNELDLALIGGMVRHPELLSVNCIEDQIVCFASPRHPLAVRSAVERADLSHELCVLREPGSSTRRLVESWLARGQVELGRVLEMRCPEVLKRLVCEGIGFSFLSIHAIKAETDRGELVRLNVADMALKRPISMAWHSQKHISPVIADFMARIAAATSRPEAATSAWDS